MFSYWKARSTIVLDDSHASLCEHFGLFWHLTDDCFQMFFISEFFLLFFSCFFFLILDDSFINSRLLFDFLDCQFLFQWKFLKNLTILEMFGLHFLLLFFLCSLDLFLFLLFLHHFMISFKCLVQMQLQAGVWLELVSHQSNHPLLFLI